MTPNRPLAKRIVGQTRKALHDYEMIRPKARIAVGVSGGKDSMSLLTALNELRKFYDASYDLHAIMVTYDRNDPNPEPIQRYCESLGVPLTIEKTQIGRVVFDVRNEKNPCALCAKMRRGALLNRAQALDCDTLALAHNRDDIIHTYLICLLYQGRMHTFSPVTELSRKKIRVIRPFIYCKEHELIGFTRLCKIPVEKNPCPYASKNKRQEVKKMLDEIRKNIPDVNASLFGAISRSGQWDYDKPDHT